MKYVATSGSDQAENCIFCNAGRYGAAGGTTSQCSGQCAIGRYSVSDTGAGPSENDCIRVMLVGMAPAATLMVLAQVSVQLADTQTQRLQRGRKQMTALRAMQDDTARLVARQASAVGTVQPVVSRCQTLQPALQLTTALSVMLVDMVLRAATPHSVQVLVPVVDTQTQTRPQVPQQLTALRAMQDSSGGGGACLQALSWIGQQEAAADAAATVAAEASAKSEELRLVAEKVEQERPVAQAVKHGMGMNGVSWPGNRMTLE